MNPNLKRTTRTHAQDGVIYEVEVERCPKCLPTLRFKVKEIDGKPALGSTALKAVETND